MGQGGHVILVNGTRYDWTLSGHGCSNMEWMFERDAKIVRSFSTCRVYVEVENPVPWPWNDPPKKSGYAIYKLGDTDFTFQIDAQNYEVSASFARIVTHNAGPGWIERHVLGSVSDWPCYFVLSGNPGDFCSVGDVRDWMQKRLSSLGPRNLGQICVPSSHDSGMNESSWLTRFAKPNAVVTQFKSVEEQLRLGIRYFDIRPYLFHGEWVCGHYSKIEKLPPVQPEVDKVLNKVLQSWQGGNGASIQSIVDGINRFTGSSRELIVLRLDEVRSITENNRWCGLNDIREANLDEWRRLLELLNNIRDLWIPLPSHGPVQDIKLTQIQLRDFIGNGRAAVVIVGNFPPEIDLTRYKGCFRPSSWEWDSSPWEGAESDRLQTFLNAKRSNPNKPYSYSGCHTQNDLEAVLSILDFPIVSTFVSDKNSVLELSKAPKEKVFRDVFHRACEENLIPSAISFDAIRESDIAALAIAFNDRAIL